MQYTEKTQIEQIFQQQKTFFSQGKTRDVAFRKQALTKLKESLLAHKEPLYVAMAEDLGRDKALVDMGEIGEVVSEIDFALAHLDDWCGEKQVETPTILAPSSCSYQHEPYGVNYIIGPFNYPVALALGPVVGAIAGGNTAVIKPSEQVPYTAKVIEDIVNTAFDSHYLAVVQGAREENTLLLSLPFDFIFFTGSPNVGRVVMEAAAKHLTPVVLELGGKTPFLILPDADLDQVTQQLMFGKYTNSGQTCVAPDYVLVPSSLKAALVDRLTQAIREQLPDVHSTGKVVSQRQVEHLLELLKQTHGHVEIGGQADPANRYLQATVVSDVQWDDALMQEELFGPVLPIVNYEGVDQVVQEINRRHPNPLAFYVFTKDTATGKKVISAVPSGDAQVNGTLTHFFSPYLPFGGVGGSGMGEYHGFFSFQAFTHRKSIRIVE